MERDGLYVRAHDIGPGHLAVDSLSKIDPLRALASSRQHVEVAVLAGVDHFAGGSDTAESTAYLRDRVN